MTNLPNLTKLIEQATERPWKRGETYIYRPGKDGANIAAASELRSQKTVGYDHARVSSPDLKEIFSNAKLLTVAANNFEALINTVKHLLVGAEEFRDICPGCRGAGELLAKIEKEAGIK